MTYAASTTARDKGTSDGRFIDLKMSTVKICKGSLVQILADGYASSAAPVASAAYVGVAHETVDCTSPHSAGDHSIRVETEGVHNFVLNGSAAQTNVGDEVYWDDAVDSVTVKLTDPGLGAKVGRIVEVISTTEVRVLITGYAMVQANQAS